MSVWKMLALAALGSFAAMIAATWWYGVTGGRLIAWVGPSGLLLILAATAAAMLVVALWRPPAPTVSARAPGWEREGAADDVVADLRRQASQAPGGRRAAPDRADDPFTGRSGF